MDDSTHRTRTGQEESITRVCVIPRGLEVNLQGAETNGGKIPALGLRSTWNADGDRSIP
jgi:hypothetical protein